MVNKTYLTYRILLILRCNGFGLIELDAQAENSGKGLHEDDAYVRIFIITFGHAELLAALAIVVQNV